MKRFIAVLMAAMLMLSVFAGCSETPAQEESPVALRLGETEFTLEEVNFMYISFFNEIYYNLYSMYGSYISSIVDTSVPLEEQMIDENTTWHQYLVEYTVNGLRSFTGVYEVAKKEGYVLPEQFQTEIDNFEAELDETAAANGMTRDEFITLSYGKGISLETIKKMTEFRYYVAAYAEDYEAGIVVTDEDIDAYYSANKDYIDTVDFRYYSSFYETEEQAAENEAAEGEEEDEIPALTQEEAEAQANALAEVHTAEEFNALAKEYTLDEEQKKLFDESDATLFAGAGYDSIGIEEVTEWLFDEARQPGETMVYHDEEYTSYLTVMFEKRVDPNYDLIDIRHILIIPEAEDDGSISDEAWAAAEQEANAVYDGYLAGEQTEDAFAALAVEHSKDGNAAQGGIYENVAKGQMVPTFNDWCFDSARKTGDTGIVKTPYGYHIMYFSGFGDNNLLTVVEPAVKNQYAEAWLGECTGNIVEERTEAFENVGGMVDDIVAATNEFYGASAETETEKEANSLSGIIIGVLVVVIIICIVIIAKNGKKAKASDENTPETDEAEEPVLEATDEDLTEEELLAEEAFEETVPEEETAEEVTEEAAEEEASEESEEEKTEE